MKKILVPVDGSATSLKALDEAKALATTFGAEIIILSVWDDRSLFMSSTSAVRTGVTVSQTMLDARKLIQDQEEENHKTVLNDLVAGLATIGINARGVFRTGLPYEEILAIADEEEVDTIIIGSRGLTTATKRFILGSVSEKIVFRAKCNVMVVKL